MSKVEQAELAKAEASLATRKAWLAAQEEKDKVTSRKEAYKRAVKEAEDEGHGHLVDHYDTCTPEEEQTAEGLADFLDQYLD